MPLPTSDELEAALTTYVDAKPAAADYVAECVAEAIAFITVRVPNTTTGVEVIDGYLTPAVESSPLGNDIYKREVLELGSELYYRRAARNGIIATNAMDGSPVRLSKDPYGAAEARLTRFRPLGFA